MQFLYALKRKLWRISDRVSQASSRSLRPLIESLETRMQLSGSMQSTLMTPLDVHAPAGTASGPIDSTSQPVPPVQVGKIPANAQLPDLTPWASRSKGYIYGFQFDKNEIPGRTLLRLTTAVANAGGGSLEIIGGPPTANGRQSVYQRIHDTSGGYTDRLAGTFVFHPTHGHTHFENFALYRLRQIKKNKGVGRIVRSGSKTSFCLTDSDIFNAAQPGRPKTPYYDQCSPDIQGVSVGWADVYDLFLPDQWIDITGVKPGKYWLEVVVDPNHRLLDANRANNVTRIQINIPANSSVAANAVALPPAMTSNIRPASAPNGAGAFDTMPGAHADDQITTLQRVLSKAAAAAADSPSPRPA